MSLGDRFDVNRKVGQGRVCGFRMKTAWLFQGLGVKSPWLKLGAPLLLFKHKWTKKIDISPCIWSTSLAFKADFSARLEGISIPVNSRKDMVAHLIQG